MIATRHCQWATLLWVMFVITRIDTNNIPHTVHSLPIVHGDLNCVRRGTAFLWCLFKHETE